MQILVLGFCDSQRDLEVVQKILSQVGTVKLGSIDRQAGHFASDLVRGLSVGSCRRAMPILRRGAG